MAAKYSSRSRKTFFLSFAETTVVYQVIGYSVQYVESVERTSRKSGAEIKKMADLCAEDNNSWYRRRAQLSQRPLPLKAISAIAYISTRGEAPPCFVDGQPRYQCYYCLCARGDEPGGVNVGTRGENLYSHCLPA